MIKKFKPYIIFVFAILTGIGCTSQNIYIERADESLNTIKKHFKPDGNGFLFNENCPYNEKNTVTYVINQDTVSKNKVAYLWPTSGMLSAVVALYENTMDKKYKTILDSEIVPALNCYFDTVRKPVCYQSYISADGLSDRYYDDNVWLTIDFADIALANNDNIYLLKAEEIWEFVISGWDEKLGGGIYWCEQKKESKNTCSNAPSAVAAAKLYLATQNTEYLQWAEKIYVWTKLNLQDSTDYLYFDNITIADGHISKQKYAYNSGQMMQAAALLFKITNDSAYLNDAIQLAAACYKHFFTDIMMVNGQEIRLVKRGDVWFTAIMLRGFIELYKINGNKEYVKAFKQNLDYVWENARDENGLFEDDWSGKEKKASKWLLPQAAMVEMYARLSKY